jgi:hypothetical protein
MSPRTNAQEFLGLPIRTKTLWFTLKPSMHQNPFDAPPNSGCLRPSVEINRLLSVQAANFSLGLSPALDASRTSMSKLN